MRSLTYLQPGLVLVIGTLALAAIRRSRRLLVTATAALFLWSSQPFAEFLMATLERRYPVRDYPAGDADAIVLLGGGVYKSDPGLPEHLPAEDTYIRARYAAWLHRNWRPLPILISGGEVGSVIRIPLADIVRPVIEQAGVPPSMIWTEERSQSTYENARFSADLLRSKGVRRIALVTEAYHMRRSEQSFRRAGLIVIPAPCAFRYTQFSGAIEQWIPNATGVRWNELVLHEWLALAWYRIAGKA